MKLGYSAGLVICNYCNQIVNLLHLPIKGQQYSFEQYLEFVTQLVKDSQHSGQTEDATLKNLQL